MGAVTNIITTGDNNKSVYPIRYYNHYLYCDHCGSFDLMTWIEPENHQALKRIGKMLRRINYLTFFFLIIAILFALNGASAHWVFFLVLCIVFGLITHVIDSKIKELGLVCVSCQTKYPYGSQLFTHTSSNPKNYKMSDVPLPLNTVFQIRGEELGPDPT